MRYSILAAIGLAGLLVIGGLRLGGGQVDARETPESGLRTFAGYAENSLKVGVQITLQKGYTGAGYAITVLPEGLAETLKDERSTVKEIGVDYIVVRQEREKTIVETVVPFHAIASIQRYVDTESK